MAGARVLISASRWIALGYCATSAFAVAVLSSSVASASRACPRSDGSFTDRYSETASSTFPLLPSAPAHPRTVSSAAVSAAPEAPVVSA